MTSSALPMMRTVLMRTAAVLSLATGAERLSADEAFDFERLRARVREAAGKAHEPAVDDLADFWKNLTYDQHRDIRFRMEEGLWAKEKLPFSVDLFHPGWTAKKTVRVNEVAGGRSRAVVFDRGMFDYGKNVIPAEVPPPPGYAGWRARYHLNSPDYMDEFLVFLGASYFRAIPAQAPYGLSARGLSIDSGLPGVPEEFPDFREFWLEKPEAGAKQLRAWAQLESPSAAGAYQFAVTPGVETVMEVEAELTLRRPVKQLGLAPFSSMYWFGEGTHPKPYDFRPEVHDSDGLLMELESGAQHFRPLETTKGQFRHCVFGLERPRSWGLVQRDRSFASYLDVEARYHDRPSVVVEPVEGFAAGRLHLIEMPTEDETNDNVILVWEPEPGLEPGKPHRFRYRLRWLRDPATSGLFQVRGTRCGHPVQQADKVLVTVDFAKPLHPVKKVGEMKWDDLKGLKPVVTVNQPGVKVVHAGLDDLSMAHVDDLPLGLGRGEGIHMPQVLRAFFVLEPPPGMNEMDLTCELRDAAGKAVSERWVWLWRR